MKNLHSNISSSYINIWRIRIIAVMSVIILHSSFFILHSTEHTAIVSDSVQLSQVVVTGTMTPKTIANTPITTQVITARDIQRTDATDIQDLLQQVLPGTEFSYAMNQQTHLNFAGFGGQGILFLVDGERLAGETLDDVDFSRIIMSGVERVEIVRGAASALYGSSAGGGVINVITKEGGNPWTLHLDSRWSRHGGQRYGLQFGRNTKRFTNLFNASFSDTDNYSVSSEANPATRVFSEVYGSKVVNVKDRLTFNITDNLKLTGRVGYYFRQVPRVITEPERYRDLSAGLKASWQMTARDRLEISYAFDEYDKSTKQRLAGLDIRSYSNVQNSVKALYTTTTGGGTLIFGADFMRDYLSNNKLSTPRHHQYSFDAFAQYDWNVSSRWELVGALRFDHFSDGNLSRFTPKLSARYSIIPRNNETGESLTLRLGYGMGFRAPTLKEKYYEFDMAGIWIVKGNENLKAETSHNFTASLGYTREHYALTLMGYYNNVRNKIATGVPYSSSQFTVHNSQLESQLSTPILPYVNLSHYSVYGAELLACAQWGIMNMTLGYAYTNDNANGNNQYLPARPHSLTWQCTLDKRISDDYRVSATLSGRFLSAVSASEYVDYYDISKGMVSVRYPAYSLWKLSLVQTFWQKAKLTLTLDNLFNYKPRYYYMNAPITDGTNFMLGLSVEL